jgi:Tfp pilus assembly protein FimT
MSAVIAIVMLFAALAMPNLLSRRASREVAAFFVRLPDLAVFAREYAQRKEKTVRVTFDETRGVFSVEADGEKPEDERSVVRELPLAEGLRAVGFRQEDRSVSSGEWEMVFYPDGRSDGAGVEVDDNGRIRSVTVSPDGVVRIQEGTMPTVEERRWPAGEREQRLTGGGA